MTRFIVRWSRILTASETCIGPKFEGNGVMVWTGLSPPHYQKLFGWDFTVHYSTTRISGLRTGLVKWKSTEYIANSSYDNPMRRRKYVEMTWDAIQYKICYTVTEEHCFIILINICLFSCSWRSHSILIFSNRIYINGKKIRTRTGKDNNLQIQSKTTQVIEESENFTETIQTTTRSNTKEVHKTASNNYPVETKEIVSSALP